MSSSTDEIRSLTVTVFCGDHEASINVPRDASSKEVAAIFKKSLGVRGSFFLRLRTDDAETPATSRSQRSIYLHCSSIKAAVLERYANFTWEIRGPGYQRGGDSLWYYQSQELRPDVWQKLEEDQWEPLDFPP